MEAEGAELAVLTDLEALESACSMKRVQAVVVEGIEATVYVRMLTVGEFERLESWMDAARKKPGDKDLFRARCVSLFLSDADGRRVVKDTDLTRVKALPIDVVQTIFDAGLEFNSPTEEDIEELEKN